MLSICTPSDSIHPSIFGTYLVSICFLLRLTLSEKCPYHPLLTTTGIPDSNAVQLRYAAHTTVNDSLSKWLSNGHIPISSFISHVVEFFGSVYFRIYKWL
jgi:hypothetical protein